MSNLSTSDKMKLRREADAAIRLLRKQAWDDLYTFTKIVCGRNLMEIQPHKEVCEMLTLGLDKSDLLNLNFRPPLTTKAVKEAKGKLKKLLMIPRGAFKSTIATNAFPLWLLWHNPDLRIMIDSETLSNAKMYLAGIKDMIENNQLLRKICTDDDGNYILEADKSVAGGWTDGQIILKARQKLGLKEPSIFLSGVDNARTGMHPDVIIMDDLVSERNVTTDDQINKVGDHYKFSLSLLEPGGLQVVIGTRYHMADLYGDLLEMGSYDVYVRPAIAKDGTLFFPTRLTEEFLAEKKKEQGAYIYSSQYMLSPLDEDTAVFRADDIRYYTKLPVIKKSYILMDLAISQKETADYTVIMVVGEDANKNLYVIEYVREHMLPAEMINTLFDVYQRNQVYRVQKVGIESVQFQKALSYFIKDEMKRRGVFMRIVDLKADKDKQRRIRALQPLFEAHTIFIKREHTALESELMEFPFSKHDDTLDALAYILQILKPGRATTRRRYSHIRKSVTGY